MAQEVCRFVEDNKDRRFVDACCGVGFFALHLAKKLARGIGFDISKENIYYARHNATRNGIHYVTFFTSDVSSLNISPAECDVFIIDPPRAGLSKKSRKTIIFLEPQKIAYISCNPTTFARDASDFIGAGYTVSQLAFIDMFPATKHIELIGLFERAV
jgi:23S rRNA (uracil1939-C5)-methyltransferase